MNQAAHFKCAVLISGYGSNLQAIIDACITQQIPGEICCVISSNPDAFGLERAKHAQIPTAVITAQDHPDPNDYDRALMRTLAPYQPDLIVLAGFMRILRPALIDHYFGKIINIHPALLPKYRGLKTYQRVLAAGDSEHGTSVHFVTPELDAGPVIAQAKLAVDPTDTPESLKARVQQLEHQLYPKVISLFATGRIILTPQGPSLDGKLLKN